MKVAIYTICWNEELLLPFFISHYKKRFPRAEINIYDNMSTDKSVDIAKSNNCNVIQYDTGNKLNDVEYLKIKNHAWRESKADWILVCDIDEFLDINDSQLEQEHLKGANLIKAACFNMVNLSDDPNNTDVSNIKYGFRHRHWKMPSDYDKVMMWNIHQIKLITYNAGAHICHPYPREGFSPKIAKNKYNMYHYKYIGENYYVNRIKQYASRLSEDNLKRNWATGYLADAEVHRKNFQSIKLRNDLFKVIDKHIKDDVVLKNQQKVIDFNGLHREANQRLSNWCIENLTSDKTKKKLCRCGFGDDSKDCLLLENVSRCIPDIETFGFKNVICTFEDMVCEDDGRTFFVLPEIVSLFSFRKNKWGDSMSESLRYIPKPKEIIEAWVEMSKMPSSKIINYDKFLKNTEYRDTIALNLGFKNNNNKIFEDENKINITQEVREEILSNGNLIEFNDEFFGVDTRKLLGFKISKHICFYYRKDRIKFLKQVLEATNEYPYQTDVFIHTNDSNFNLKDIDFSYNNGLINFIYHDLSNCDPFLLSHKCRDLLKKQKDQYDAFMYTEDDILVTKENINYWFKYYKKISNLNSNLGFFRVESWEGDEFVCDITHELFKIRTVDNFRCVINHLVPYCAFWIYDKYEFNKWVENEEWYDPSKIPRYGTREKSAIGMAGIKPSIFNYTYIPITEDNKPLVGSKVMHLDPRFAMIKTYPNGTECKFAKIPFNKIIKKEVEEE